MFLPGLYCNYWKQCLIYVSSWSLLQLLEAMANSCFFLVFTAITGSSCAEEDCTDTNGYWKTLNPFILEKGVAPVDFFAGSFCC